MRRLGGFVDVGEEGCFGEFHEEGCLLPGNGGEVLEEIVEIEVVKQGLDGDASIAEAGFSAHATFIDPHYVVDGGVDVVRHAVIRACRGVGGYCLKGRG